MLSRDFEYQSSLSFGLFSGLFIGLQIKFGFGLSFSGFGLKCRHVYSSNIPILILLMRLPRVPNLMNLCLCVYYIYSTVNDIMSGIFRPISDIPRILKVMKTSIKF